jgi:hypothetical protein
MGGMMNEVGRELKVSELKPKTVVVVAKQLRPAATVWVVEIHPEYVHFRAGSINMEFLAARTGPDLEQITDDSGLPMRVYEYLGEI